MATARFLLFTPPWQHQSRANAGARLHPHRCGAPHSPQPLCAGSWTAGAANRAMANAIAAVGTYPGYQSGVTAMVLQGQMTGINDVVFASSKLGVAVGAGLSSGTTSTLTFAVSVPAVTAGATINGAGITNSGATSSVVFTATGGTASATGATLSSQITEGAYAQGANSAIGYNYLPTVLLTFDQGASWVAATGFTPVVPIGYNPPVVNQAGAGTTPGVITTLNQPLVRRRPVAARSLTSATCLDVPAPFALRRSPRCRT